MKKTIKSIAKILLTISIFKFAKKITTDAINDSECERNRYLCYYYLMKQWVSNNRKNISSADYLRNNHISSIAIYGTGTLGDMLYGELKDTEIKIKYVIDKSRQESYNNIPVIDLKHIKEQPSVDAIIVTPIFDYSEIIQEIEKYDKKIVKISLEKLIYGV